MRCCSEQTVRARNNSPIILKIGNEQASNTTHHEPLLASFYCARCRFSVAVIVHHMLQAGWCPVCGTTLECDMQS